MLRSRKVSRRATSLVAALTVILVACGGGDDDAVSSGSAATTGTVTDVSLVPATPPTAASVPEVVLPEATPTELVKTVITPGDGSEPAVDGQIVVVDYVGVRSEDGEQFDASYGRGPIAVRLGEGRVVPGWEQGLVGATPGERLQLDIPAELGYGDEPRGGIIQAGDALSFVIDVRSVVPGDAPAAADIPTSDESVTEVTTEDVRPGTGATLELGDTGLFHVLAARADDGTVLSSSWEAGQAEPLTVSDDGLVPGLAEGLVGMQVGGRRMVTLPYTADSGLTPETDVLIIADLLAVT